jgi:hypothetical protein
LFVVNKGCSNSEGGEKEDGSLVGRLLKARPPALSQGGETALTITLGSCDPQLVQQSADRSTLVYLTINSPQPVGLPSKADRCCESS